MSKKKLIILITTLIVVAAAGAGYYFFRTQSEERVGENTISYSKPTDDQLDAGQQAKKDFIERTEAQSGSTSGNDSTNGHDSAPADTSVAVQITSASQAGGVLRARTIISVIDNTGSCTATLKKSGSANITETAGVQSMGSYSVCKGFDIDTASMEKGTWSLSIDYAGGAGQKGVATKEVSIQ